MVGTGATVGSSFSLPSEVAQAAQAMPLAVPAVEIWKGLARVQLTACTSKPESAVSIAPTMTHFLMQIFSSVVQQCIKMDLSKKAELIIQDPNNFPSPSCPEHLWPLTSECPQALETERQNQSLLLCPRVVFLSKHPICSLSLAQLTYLFHPYN